MHTHTHTYMYTYVCMFLCDKESELFSVNTRIHLEIKIFIGEYSDGVTYKLAQITYVPYDMLWPMKFA